MNQIDGVEKGFIHITFKRRETIADEFISEIYTLSNFQIEKLKEEKMTVKELIKKLQTFDPDLPIYVSYKNGDAYGSGWQDIEDFDEDDVKLDGRIVILDIYDK